MRELIAKFEKYLDGLTRRDQISLAVIVFVVVLAIWLSTVHAPLRDSMMAVDRDIQKKDSELLVVQAKMKALQQSMSLDRDREDKEELARYIEENTRLDEALTKTSSQIINPQEMVSLLEQILKHQAGLKFVSLKNKPSIPEFIESRVENVKAVDRVNTIYRHSVVLQMEGSYHSALSYMKKLEQLPWRFFWQGVEMETKDYPNAVITLEVYTLGFREGLIGV